MIQQIEICKSTLCNTAEMRGQTKVTTHNVPIWLVKYTKVTKSKTTNSPLNAHTDKLRRHNAMSSLRPRFMDNNYSIMRMLYCRPNV